MPHLIPADASYLAELERRIEGSLVVFHSLEMPPGVLPPRARVGVERDRNGDVLFRVDPASIIPQFTPSVRQWLSTGLCRFRSFDEFVEFLHDDLHAAYRTEEPAADAEPSPLTRILDSPAVQTALEDLANSFSPSVEPDRLLACLRRSVRGQDRSLELLAEAVARHTSKSHPRRPLSVFMLGPTGTGKTRTAEVLAAALGPADRFLRLDMNEYKERHRVSQLLGAPQGYVGHGDGAVLTDHLDAHSDGIVLFDEIEKAHPSLFEVLMNLMDAGRLSRPDPGRNSGRQINARQAILIFTSNHPVESLADQLSDDISGPELNEMCRRVLVSEAVAPAIAARVGTYLVLGQLPLEARAEVLWLAIRSIGAEYGVPVADVDPLVVAHLLRIHVDSQFGARPLEHLIEEQLGSTFAAQARTGTGSACRLKGPPYHFIDAG